MIRCSVGVAKVELFRMVDVGNIILRLRPGGGGPSAGG